MLFWYAAETVPFEVEQIYSSTQASETNELATRTYRPPAAFPNGMTVTQRVAQDTITGDDGKQKLYEPVWHPGTGMDEEERLYRSYLLTVPEARRKLRGSVMEDVVRRSWEAIQLRKGMESKDST